MQLDACRVLNANAPELSVSERRLRQSADLEFDIPASRTNSFMPIGCGYWIWRLFPTERIVLDLSVAKADPGVSLILSSRPNRAARKASNKRTYQQTTNAFLARAVSLMPRWYYAAGFAVILPVFWPVFPRIFMPKKNLRRMKEIVTPSLCANSDRYLFAMKVKMWVIWNFLYERPESEQEMPGHKASPQWTF